MNNRKDLDDSIRMLQGNVNRMCITDDKKELDDMKEWAIKRVSEIYAYNLERLK